MANVDILAVPVLDPFLAGQDHFVLESGDYALSLSEQIARLAYVCDRLSDEAAKPVNAAIALLANILAVEAEVRVVTATKALEGVRPKAPTRLTTVRPVAPREED
jgi:hypothetical protein